MNKETVTIALQIVICCLIIGHLFLSKAMYMKDVTDELRIIPAQINGLTVLSLLMSLSRSSAPMIGA